jgi:hypothetical protein
MRPLTRLAPLVILLAACTGESSVLVYNDAPTAAILTPVDGHTVDENVPITFEGRVSDDGPLPDLVIQWASDKDGLLSETSTPDPDGRIEYTTANLSPGNHVISLRVIDDEGEQGTATLQVGIVDLPDPPTIDLVRPTQGETWDEGGDPFPFTAVVEDAQDPPDALEVVFLSSLDGFLCAATPDATGEARCAAEPTPDRDPHLITAEVTDSDGNMDNATAYMTARALAAQDNDGDGFTPNAGDCDDNNDEVFPGALEQPNERDDDCDGTIDEGTINFDDDGDGYAEVDGDCDDTNRLTFPDAREVEDGEDNDCDGTIDEGTAVFDDDGDGYSEEEGDCDDAVPEVSPDAVESCNGRDDDCDGTTDEEDASGCSTWYADRDMDTYGDPGDSRCLCAAVAPHNVSNSRDCYDGNAAARPGQLSWFGSDRGDGRFDYDCNGTQQQRYTAIWDCSAAVWICGSHTDGWRRRPAPSCGVTTTWARGCDAGFAGCDPDRTESRQQMCR